MELAILASFLGPKKIAICGRIQIFGLPWASRAVSPVGSKGNKAALGGLAGRARLPLIVSVGIAKGQVLCGWPRGHRDLSRPTHAEIAVRLINSCAKDRRVHTGFEAQALNFR